MKNVKIKVETDEQNLKVQERVGELNDAGVFSTTQDVIDFFDKPWKWSEELKELMEINK